MCVWAMDLCKVLINWISSFKQNSKVFYVHYLCWMSLGGLITTVVQMFQSCPVVTHFALRLCDSFHYGLELISLVLECGL